MIGTLDIRVNAANPNLPLATFFAFVNSPSHVRVINVPRKIGSWAISKVYVTANYPDNTSRSVEATLTGGCWHATLVASTAVGTAANGFAITADGVGEDGTTAVTGYVLGKGDLEILSTDATVTVGTTTYYAHILDAQPTTPHKGDMCVIDGVWKLYNGTSWISLGGVAEVDWSNITNKPTSFAPTSHASTHGSSGTDPITPAAIGAATATDISSAVSTHNSSDSAHASLLIHKRGTLDLKTYTGRSTSDQWTWTTTEPSTSQYYEVACDFADHLNSNQVKLDFTNEKYNPNPSYITHPQIGVIVCTDGSGVSGQEGQTEVVMSWKSVQYEYFDFEFKATRPITSYTPTDDDIAKKSDVSSAVSTHNASASAHATQFANKLDSSSGDASVGWNEDDNLAVSGGKFVGSFDGEFMAAAWNDYKIDLGGGETAELPEELAAQIGNHNTASDAHATKFAAKQDTITSSTNLSVNALTVGGGVTVTSGDITASGAGVFCSSVYPNSAIWLYHGPTSFAMTLKANAGGKAYYGGEGIDVSDEPSEYEIANHSYVGTAVAADVTHVKSITAPGVSTPVTPDANGQANVSSLFSSDNTSNNLDNIRKSASDATTAKSYIDTQVATKASPTDLPYKSAAKTVDYDSTLAAFTIAPDDATINTVAAFSSVQTAGIVKLPVPATGKVVDLIMQVDTSTAVMQFTYRPLLADGTLGAASNISWKNISGDTMETGTSKVYWVMIQLWPNTSSTYYGTQTIRELTA